MLTVAWELPHDAAVLRAWLAAPLHRRVSPGHLGSEGTISHWQASYQRDDYPEALNVLVGANLAWFAALRARGLVPRELYASGVRYARECCGEVWRAWPALLERGFGDCEDLAAARCAELVCRRVPARVELVTVAQQRDGSRAYHVLVRTPAGTEDPSALLGDDGTAACDILGPRGVPCAASIG